MDFLFQYIWTPIAVFLVGFVLLRIIGKKAVAEMTSFDLLVVLILGTTITEPIVTKRLGIASYFAVVVVIVYIVFSLLALQNKFKSTLNNTPTVLIRNGDIDFKGLKNVRMSTEELLAILRKKGYTSANDLALVVMEATGQFSAIPMADKRPLQANDINMSPSPAFIPIPLIIDGQIIDHNLKYVQKDREWLSSQLQAYNLSFDNINLVTLATLNQKGFLDVDTQDPNDRNEGTHNYKPGIDN